VRDSFLIIRMSKGVVAVENLSQYEIGYYHEVW
jgi:hypothetical protein